MKIKFYVFYNYFMLLYKNVYMHIYKYGYIFFLIPEKSIDLKNNITNEKDHKRECKRRYKKKNI